MRIAILAVAVSAVCLAFTAQADIPALTPCPRNKGDAAWWKTLEETDALVSRHYLDDSTGDWIPSGILCRKTDVFKTDAGGDCSPKKPLSARTYLKNRIRPFGSAQSW